MNREGWEPQYMTDDDMNKIAKGFPNGNDLSDAYDSGFKDGIKFALKTFAWWKNGEEYIGRQRHDRTGDYTLKQAIEIAFNNMKFK